jgi:hypothetical protein
MPAIEYNTIPYCVQYVCFAFSSAADKTVTIAMFSFPFLSSQALSAAETLQNHSQRRFRANTNTSDETEGSASTVDLVGGAALGSRDPWKQVLVAPSLC